MFSMQCWHHAFQIQWFILIALRGGKGVGAAADDLANYYFKNDNKQNAGLAKRHYEHAMQVSSLL